MEGLISLLVNEKSCVLICQNSLKKRVLKRINQINDIKFKTPKQAVNDLLGYYDDIAIYEIKKSLKTSYEHAKKIFDVLPIIDDKMKYFYLKDSLKKYYHEPIKYNVPIVVCGKTDRYLRSILKGKNVIYYEKEEKNNLSLFEYETIIEEVEALANNVSKLLYDGNNDIVIYYNNNEYVDVIKDVFPFYNIKYNIDYKQLLYDIPVVKKIVDDFSLIDSIKDERIKNKVIDCINKLVTFDYSKDDLIDELKHTKIENVKYKNVLEIKKYDYFNPFSDYTFIIGKSNKIIPTIYKDNDFISDCEYERLGYETSVLLNKYEKEYFQKTAKQCQNIVISYSKRGISDSFDDANMGITPNKEEIDYLYSEERANLEYMKQYFIYLKYGKKGKKLNDFYSSFKYEKYDNSYNTVNRLFVEDALIKDNTIDLSYSKLKEFYKCPFSYYCKYIMNIKEPFNNSNEIGNFFHLVLEEFNKGTALEDCLKKGFEILNVKDVYKEIYEVYIDKIINKIKEQSEVLEKYKEKKVEKSFVRTIGGNPEIRLSGRIDNLLINNKKAIVIDYKTGKDTINLKDEVNQLIIYLLLLENLEFAGIFIQHVFPSSFKEAKDNSFYKLEGYFSEEIGVSINNIAKVKNRLLSGDEIKKYKESALEYIKVFKQKVLNAEFDINPKENACDYCPYFTLCFKKKIEGDEDAMD